MAAITANTRPTAITMPRLFSRPRLPAAAIGPGVGGTRVWVANRPVESATVIATGDTLRVPCHRAFQAVENHVAGITENRDGNNEPDQRHGQGGEFLPQQLYDGLCHDNRRTGTFQDHTNDGTEDDHKANIAKDVTESGADGFFDVVQRQAEGKGCQE